MQSKTGIFRGSGGSGGGGVGWFAYSVTDIFVFSIVGQK